MTLHEKKAALHWLCTCLRMHCKDTLQVRFIVLSQVFEVPVCYSSSNRIRFDEVITKINLIQLFDSHGRSWKYRLLCTAKMLYDIPYPLPRKCLASYGLRSVPDVYYSYRKENNQIQTEKDLAPWVFTWCNYRHKFTQCCCNNRKITRSY